MEEMQQALKKIQEAIDLLKDAPPSAAWIVNGLEHEADRLAAVISQSQKWAAVDRGPYHGG